MNKAFQRWLKSEVTAAVLRVAYLCSWKASFPKPSSGREILFILGSGASVDRLKDEHWRIIASQKSIGVNFWTIHSFSPDYYALEKTRGVNTVQALEPLINGEKKVRGVRVLWFGGPNRVNRGLLRVFRRLGGRIWFYSGWPLDQEATRGSRAWFFRLVRAFQRLPRPLRPALDVGNTVSRLVTMAIINGWGRVVLLGVDLGGPYFDDYVNFFKKVSHTTQRGVPQGLGPDHKHHVDAVARGEFRISAFLPQLDSWAREIGAGQIFDGTLQGDGRLGLATFEWRG